MRPGRGNGPSPRGTVRHKRQRSTPVDPRLKTRVVWVLGGQRAPARYAWVARDERYRFRRGRGYGGLPHRDRLPGRSILRGPRVDGEGRHHAVLAAVAEVDDEPDHQPDHEP